MKCRYAIYSIVLLLLLLLEAKGQNLVSNGNFEIVNTCPNDYSQTTYCTGWRNLVPNCSFEQHTGCPIQLFDVLGRIVLNIVSTKEKHTLNTSTFTTGTYLLQLTDINGDRLSATIIKE